MGTKWVQFRPFFYDVGSGAGAFYGVAIGGRVTMLAVGDGGVLHTCDRARVHVTRARARGAGGYSDISDPIKRPSAPAKVDTIRARPLTAAQRRSVAAM